MGVIFAGSTDLGASHRTSRIIGPILRWFNPNVSDETIRAIQAVVRKGAHITEYGILAMLTWRGWRVARGENVLTEKWDWREAAGVIAFCAFYAVTDELHQKFVSSRQAHPVDVLLDSFGALCGLGVLWIIARWKGRR